jgi:arginine decarboxylase
MGGRTWRKMMVIQTPTKYFLVSGDSEGFSLLNAFDGALLNSGVGDTNLVRMSSILPPFCERIEPIVLPYGTLVPVAYASITSDLYGEEIGSAVAIGIPKDKSLAGLIMEYSAKGFAAKEVEQQVRKMVQAGMERRNREIETILSISATHKVVVNGATFAGVVLWD